MLTISVIYSFYNTAQFHRKETITKVVNRVNILNLTNLQHLIHDAHICMTAMPKVLIIMMSECFENDEHVQARLRPCRGILVQLVICMSPGHPKIKIANFMKFITFARFLPLNTILWLKNIFGNLKAQLTNILWPINEN